MRRRSHQSAEETRFLVDAMLGSLARKLRAFGFDARYEKDSDDNGLLRLAASEGRVLVTADRELASRAEGEAPFILLKGQTDAQRLTEMRLAAEVSGLRLVAAAPKCSRCGEPLEKAGRGEVSDRVPAGVSKRHREFFVCGACGAIYWKGSHWKKLRSLRKRLVA